MCNDEPMPARAPAKVTPTDLITSTAASELLPLTAKGKVRRIEPYHRQGRITPVMRAGSSKRSPLLFSRKDVEELRAEIVAGLQAQLGDAVS
jgi:hypothetical protein